MAWQDWLHSMWNEPPLQPVLGDPINPAYQQMPNAASVTDVRGAGPSSWASRPHDQDLLSRNMAGYYRPLVGNEMDAYSWQKTHGWLGRDPPKTPLPDPDYIPTDPSIMARIKAAQDAQDADEMGGWGPVTPSQNLPGWGG
jgi:hypothetical protein